jgi:hypothetical protein
LGKLGRVPALISKIRYSHAEFVGIMETKKNPLSTGFLKTLSGNVPFNWHHLEARGSAGGILVGANRDVFNMAVDKVLKFSVSVILTNKSNGFAWKLVVVYGPAYDELRQEFLDELEIVMGSWKGPIMVGGDFNFVRFASDKSNGIYNHRWADGFNEWVSKWALMELNPSNKKFTWTNNQEHPILAKIDMIFVSGLWDAAFPLAVLKL